MKKIKLLLFNFISFFYAREKPQLTGASFLYPSGPKGSAANVPVPDTTGYTRGSTYPRLNSWSELFWLHNKELHNIRQVVLKFRRNSTFRIVF